MIKKKIYGDYIWTLITQIIIGITGVLLVIAISKFYSTESYGEYYLIKRVSDLVWLVSLLGLTVSIPRNKVFLKDSIEDSLEKIIVIIAPILMFTFIIVSKSMSKLFLGDYHQDYYILFVLLVLGMILYGITYAYFRAALKFKVSNLIQIITYCFVPFISLFFTDSIYSYIKFYSISVLMVNSIIFCVSFSRYFASIFKLSKYQIRKLIHDTQFIIKYGIFRLPGLFLAGLIFTLPITLLNKYGTAYEVGLLSQLFQIITIINMPINSLGLLLLPNISKLVSQNRFIDVKKSVKFLMKWISIPAIPLSIILIFSSKPILNFLNEAHVQYSDIYFGFVLVGIIPMTFYNLLRNVIDAVDVRPFSTFIVLISLVIASVIGFMFYEILSMNIFLSIMLFSFLNFLFLGMTSIIITKKLILK